MVAHAIAAVVERMSVIAHMFVAASLAHATLYWEEMPCFSNEMLILNCFKFVDD